MKRVANCLIAAIVLLAANFCLAAGITEDTTWSGDKTIDAKVILAKGRLTIEPGAKITFVGQGAIELGVDATLLAKGAKDKPIAFTADHAGAITSSGAATLEHCTFTGLGGAGQKDKPVKCVQLTTAGDGIAFRNCRFSDCSAIEIAGTKPCEIIGCDFRDGRPNAEGGSVLRVICRNAKIIDNTFKGISLGGSEGDAVVVKNNLLVDGTIGGFTAFKMGQKDYSDADRKEAKAKVGNVVIENNYVHRPTTKGSYCLLWTNGTIRGNLLRGASWTSARLAGLITENVFESIPAAVFSKATGGLNDAGTHEHICGTFADAVILRNIFINPSYSAIMGIGEATCTGNIIRNNTIDMRSKGDPIMLNHLPNVNPKDIVIRNNLLLRGNAINDERGVPDSMIYCDYNLWAPTPAKGRFAKATMTGKKQGDAGFGGHDITADTTGKAITPEMTVTNPGFEFPYTDEGMLARKYRVADCVALYRQAYSLKAASPAINGGDPQDKDDPQVKDGQCDIGAIEFGATTEAPTSMPADSDSVKAPASSPAVLK